MRLTGPHRPRFEPLAKAGGSFRWGPASGQPPAGTLAVCFYRLDIAAHAASTAVVVHPAAVPIDARVGRTPACAAEAARSAPQRIKPIVVTLGIVPSGYDGPMCSLLSFR